MHSSSHDTIAPPSISALSADRPRTAGAIPENQSVKSAPRRLQIFARSPKRDDRRCTAGRLDVDLVDEETGR
jgi:hypothetical protein